VSISGTSEKSISGISGTSISPPRLTPGALVDTFGAEMPKPPPTPPLPLMSAFTSGALVDTFGAEMPKPPPTPPLQPASAFTSGALVDTFGAEMPIPLPAGILTEIPPNLLKLAVASPFGTETFGAESPAEADASTSFDFFFDFFSF